MNQRAFSFIELIGILAIAAILTALLLPKISHSLRRTDVIQTVNEAHVLELTVAIRGLESAINAHLAQFGTLASANGKPLAISGTYDQFGQILLSEGLLDRPFAPRLGTNAFIRLVNVSGLSTATPVDCANGAYDLDGDGRNDIAGAGFVAEAVIRGVTGVQAAAVDNQVDGAHLAGPGGEANLRGRVIYPKPDSDGRTELHIYLLHK